MRISEAARRLGITARMLRYRERLGLTTTRRAGEPTEHRRYDEHDLQVVQRALNLEQRYDVTPAALAFAVRVLNEPQVAAEVRDFGVQAGILPSPEERQLERERERALRWLGRSGMLPNSTAPRTPGPAAHRGTPRAPSKPGTPGAPGPRGTPRQR